MNNKNIYNNYNNNNKNNDNNLFNDNNIYNDYDNNMNNKNLNNNYNDNKYIFTNLTSSSTVPTTNPESNHSNVLINYDYNPQKNDFIDVNQSTQKINPSSLENKKLNPLIKEFIIENSPIPEIEIKKPSNKKERNNKNNPSYQKEILEKINSEINEDDVKSEYYIKDDEILFPFIIEPFKNQEKFRFFVSGNIPQLNNWDHENRPIELKPEYKNGKKFFTIYIPVKKDQFPFEFKFFYYDGRGNKIWIGKPFVNYHPPLEIFKVISKSNKNKINIFNLNIRYYNNIDKQNHWDNRKDHLIRILLNNDSDICMFQEMTRIQFDYLDREIGSVYESLGYYRDSDERSEKCCIIYNKLKFTLNEWGQFWLSSTPYVPGSNDFCNCFPRICTWASLKKLDDEDFLFFNIHLDHINLQAHINCIKVILQESEKIIKYHSYVKFILLAGCFYCEEDDPVVDLLCQNGYNELRFEKTFHDFTGIAKNHWDFMFYRENKISGIQNKVYSNKEIVFKSVQVLKEDAVIDFNKKMFVSDHFPVFAEFSEI
jgi:endonuclease/exonuclease/phosphatase family metal-dependent hydrolase